MMVDQEEGLLNKVTTERLARKVLGLIRAYDKVTCLKDWSRPQGKEGEKWKTKVDWDAARRVDPFIKESEHTIRIPALEEEVRKSMDQEALYLWTAQRLEEAAVAASRGR